MQNDVWADFDTRRLFVTMPQVCTSVILWRAAPRLLATPITFHICLVWCELSDFSVISESVEIIETPPSLYGPLVPRWLKSWLWSYTHDLWSDLDRLGRLYDTKWTVMFCQMVPEIKNEPGLKRLCVHADSHLWRRGRTERVIMCLWYANNVLYNHKSLCCSVFAAWLHF